MSKISSAGVKRAVRKMRLMMQVAEVMAIGHMDIRCAEGTRGKGQGPGDVV